MPAKIVLSIYLDAESTDDEVSSLVSDLIGKLNGTAEIEGETMKTRKRRSMTDEEKAAFRARMIAGKEAKAKTEEDAEIDAKADVDLETQTTMVGSKPIEKKADAKAQSATDRKGGRKTSTKQFASQYYIAWSSNTGAPNYFDSKIKYMLVYSINLIYNDARKTQMIPKNRIRKLLKTFTCHWALQFPCHP